MLNVSFIPMLKIVVGFEENLITIRSLYPTTDQLSYAERQLRSYCYKVSTIDDDDNTESHSPACQSNDDGEEKSGESDYK